MRQVIETLLVGQTGFELSASCKSNGRNHIVDDTWRTKASKVNTNDRRASDTLGL